MPLGLVKRLLEDLLSLVRQSVAQQDRSLEEVRDLVNLYLMHRFVEFREEKSEGVVGERVVVRN